MVTTPSTSPTTVVTPEADTLHCKIVDGPAGLGRCLRATRALAVGDIVMLERPLLFGDPPSALPPLAAFAPVPEASVPMPSDEPALGGAACSSQ